MCHCTIIEFSGNKGGRHTDSRFPIYQLITQSEMSRHTWNPRIHYGPVPSAKDPDKTTYESQNKWALPYCRFTWLSVSWSWSWSWSWSCDYWQRDNNVPNKTNLNAVVFDILSDLVSAFLEVDRIVCLVVVLNQASNDMVVRVIKAKTCLKWRGSASLQARTWTWPITWSQIEQV